MGSAKTTLGEAWLGTRLREMRVIRLKRQSYTLANRACTQTGAGRYRYRYRCLTSLNITQMISDKLTQAAATAPFIGPRHPSTAVSWDFWYLSSAD